MSKHSKERSKERLSGKLKDWLEAGIVLIRLMRQFHVMLANW